MPGVSIETSKQALEMAKTGALQPLFNNDNTIPWSYERNKHGSYAYIRKDDNIVTLTQLFKTGE